MSGGPMRVSYGRPARAYWEGDRDTLTVALESDPGAGAMTFTRISPECVEWLEGAPADRARFAAALERGAQYLTPGPTRTRLEAAAAQLRSLEIAERNYAPCPDHAGHTFNRSYGYCSCGSSHR